MRHSQELTEKVSSTPDGCRDKVLLVGTALLLILVFGSAFWLADVYQISPKWVFFAINSTGMAYLLFKDFRSSSRMPFFAAYLAGWAAVHGGVMIALMHWVPLGVWPFLIIVEGTIGLLIAQSLFGIFPDDWGR